ncbi:MAG: mechanosensitive ion channel family protein, partial [Bacteroidia bacterium]
MKTIKYIVILVILALFCHSTYSQTGNFYIKNDSINAAALKNYYSRLTVIEQQISSDSIIKADLKDQLNTLITTDSLQRESLLNRLRAVEFGERQLISEKKAKLELLRMTASGYPVTGA